MTRKVGLFASLVTLALTAPAVAHHPGGTANVEAAGPIITTPATTLEHERIAISFFAEYIRLGGLGDATLIEAASRHEHLHTIKTIEGYSVALAYGVTDDLMVSARIPYVRRTGIAEGSHQHLGGDVVLNSVTERGNSVGIGDTTLLGQWRFYNNRVSGTEAAVLFGLTVPTGVTGRGDRQGELFEAEFQPGSGAVNGIVGLALSQHFGPWSLDGNVLGIFSRRGTQETNLGNRFQYNAAVSYRVFGAVGTPELVSHAGHVHAPEPAPHSHAPGTPPHSHEETLPQPRLGVDLVLELNGDWHAHEVIAGITDPNSGGNTVYVSPGIRVSQGNVSGFASFGIPVVNDLYGLQSEPRYRVLAGISVGF